MGSKEREKGTEEIPHLRSLVRLVLGLGRWRRLWHGRWGFTRPKEMRSECRISNSCSGSTDIWSSIGVHMPKRVSSFSASSR